MSGTLDGFTEARPVGVAEGETKRPEPRTVSNAMAQFRDRHAKLAHDMVRANDAEFALIRPVSADIRKAVLQELGGLAEHAISWGTVDGTVAAKERAVRYWKIFCALLAVPPTPASFRDAYILSYFAAYMGLVWRRWNGANVDLTGATVAQAVAMVRRWLAVYYNIRILEFDPVTTLVIKGLKRRSGPGLGMLEMPVVSFLFCQREWLRLNTEFSTCLADSQVVRFMVLRRISETCATSSHDGSGPGKDARYVLHVNVWFDAKWFWFRWKWTKNGPLTRPLPKGLGRFYERLVQRYWANEKWLKDHPKFKREDLAFFHVGGKPLHRRQVEKQLKFMLRRAYVEELGLGHVNLDRYRANTHSERRGGSVWYLAMIKGCAAFVKWLGNWRSLAFFSYAKVSKAYVGHSWNSVKAAFRVMDAKPLSVLHGGAVEGPVCPICGRVFPVVAAANTPAVLRQFCVACYTGPNKVKCQEFLAAYGNNV